MSSVCYFVQHSNAKHAAYVFLQIQVYQEEFGTVRGHFGPVNAVAFHPDGRRYGIKLNCSLLSSLCMPANSNSKIHCANAALACSFVTGGEDGYVRLQHFDATYFNMLNKQEL